MNIKMTEEILNTETQGPKTVRMYKRDRQFVGDVNNESMRLQKHNTNTIKEMSCESQSIELSPKS